MKKLLISGLPYETSSKDLENMFISFGKIFAVNIIKDKQTGVKKGIGVVEIEDDEDALRAIDELHNSYVGNYRISVKINHNK